LATKTVISLKSQHAKQFNVPYVHAQTYAGRFTGAHPLYPSEKLAQRLPHTTDKNVSSARDASGVTSFTPNESSKEGGHEWSVSALDISANVAFSASLTATPPIPRNPPSVDASATLWLIWRNQLLKAVASPGAFASRTRDFA
jgi:hypothetical protein